MTDILSQTKANINSPIDCESPSDEGKNKIYQSMSNKIQQKSKSNMMSIVNLREVLSEKEFQSVRYNPSI